jgi:SAM-dependent methyltransferase
MTTTKDLSEITETTLSYDQVPYDSKAIPLTHPARLALEATLRGLDPAPPERCRVLELGCAEAANLVAMAFHLDESRFVGIDSSAEEIECALETRDRLGLDNLELRRSNVIDLGDELGSFDYILIHGVLSWVHERVRERIFELCRTLLAPQGVAYISYNCASGWAIKAQLRRVLQAGVRGVVDPAEKVRRVRELLALLAGSPLKETVYGALLAEQAANAFQHRDQYLIHEYLSPENKAFYFREVVALAEAQGLSVLDELARATTHQSIEDTVRSGLAASFEDPIEAEELADLMLFRAFRATLFCHRDALDKAGDPAEGADRAADRGSFAGVLQPISKRLSLDPDVNEVFVTSDGVQVAAAHPLLKAALLEIGKSWPRGLRLEEIKERAELILELRRVYQPGQKVPDQELEGLRKDLLELRRLGHLELRLFEPPLSLEPGAAPKVSALTRLEASRAPYVTTPHHRVIALDPFTQHLVAHLDGSRDIEMLTARMKAHFEAGDVVARDPSGELLEPPEVREALPGLVKDALRGLAGNALLV